MPRVNALHPHDVGDFVGQQHDFEGRVCHRVNHRRQRTDEHFVLVLHRVAERVSVTIQSIRRATEKRHVREPLTVRLVQDVGAQAGRHRVEQVAEPLLLAQCPVEETQMKQTDRMLRGNQREIDTRNHEVATCAN